MDFSITDEKILVPQLMEQMSTLGFLVIKNIPDYNEEPYFYALQKFHRLPEEIKRQMFLSKDNPENTNKYRGYQPFVNNDQSHKEFYEEGPPLSEIEESEKKNFPLYEAQPFNPANLNFPEANSIRAEFDAHNKLMMEVGMKLTRLLAIGLGKPFDYFDEWFVNGSLTTFRNIHYIPRSQSTVDNSKLDQDSLKLTTPAHSDSGFMTILTTFGYPGLQVLIDGVYRSIKPQPGVITVNIGDLFAKITGYKLQSTFHRVLDIGRERWSAPCFMEPKYSARVPKVSIMESKRKSINDERYSSEDGFLYGDWLIKRFMTSYAEWKNFEVPANRKAAVDGIS